MEEILAELQEIKKALQAIASSLEREPIFNAKLKEVVRFSITLGIGFILIYLWATLF